MSISSELAAKIRRYYYVEHWLVGTIVRQLNVHHSTVKRVLSDTGVPSKNLLTRPSIIDPYLAFIKETLARYPELRASRLYHMVCARGYPGGADHFRHLISLHRPRKVPEAYLRLRTLPAEQAQVDWGHFGHITIGQAKRPVMAFVMILSYSRKLFIHFFLNARMENFLRGHVAAFDYFTGVPKVCLYDNLKSAVLERQGDAIRFHPTLLDFSGYYRFEARPVAVARGNEKGRVERAIRYVRDNFFAARTWKDIDDLNQQALVWCDTIASNRPCPEDKSQSVQTMFEAERTQLISCPDSPYPTEEKIEVRVGKTPYVRFDLNDYSVPHTFVQQTLIVSATLTCVAIFKGLEKIATHPRCFGKAQQIETPEHIKTLVEQKKRARHSHGQHRLTQALTHADLFLKQAAEKGYSLKTVTSQLLQLLDDYGASLCDVAMKEALSQQVPHPNAVRLCLEKTRQAEQTPPPIAVNLSQHPQAREVVIKAHDLNSYSSLQNKLKDEK